MGCGCRGGSKGNNLNQQRVRANLQSPRKPFVPPGQAANPNIVPNVQGTQNFMLQQQQQQKPPTPAPQQPVSAADRRRIQRLNQEAIRRSLGR